MKKSSFRKQTLLVEGRETEIWILETPTLLKKLKRNNTISDEEYTKRLQVYNDAIELKSTLPEEYEGNLRDYQQRTVEYAKNFNSFAIFDEPRLGKTPTIISLLKEKNLLNTKIIVMSPSNIITNWIKAFKEWGNSKAERYDGGEIKGNILIMTYKRAQISNKELLKWKPEVSILDEAHTLRNSRGIRQKQKLTQKQQEEKNYIEQLKQRKMMGFKITEEQQQEIKKYEPPISQNKAILKLSNSSTYKYALTGTPNVNDVEDIFAILQFILPKFFKSFWNFIYYYFNVSTTHWGNREIGTVISKEKEQEIQEMLDYISTRNVQKEQMAWLKQPIITTTTLPLSKVQQEMEFNLLENGMLLDNYILNTLEQMTHYNSICLSPKIHGVNDNGAKIEYIIKEIKENTTENIAIFSTRTKFLKILEQELIKNFPKREYLKIRNPKESKEVQDYINDMTKEKHSLTFLGTIGKNKEGISLVGITKAFIVDQSWVPTDTEQLIHRLDATTPKEQKHFGNKYFEIIQHPNSIDTIIQKALKEKLSRTEIINNYQEFVRERRNKNGRRN